MVNVSQPTTSLFFFSSPLFQNIQGYLQVDSQFSCETLDLLFLPVENRVFPHEHPQPVSHHILC